MSSSSHHNGNPFENPFESKSSATTMDVTEHVNVNEGVFYGSTFELDHRYEGPYIQDNDVGLQKVEEEELKPWEQKRCACAIL